MLVFFEDLSKLPPKNFLFLQGDPNQTELWEQLAETFGSGGEGLPGMPGAGIEGAEEGLGAVSGMFQNMVKQLLSKELLYQPLKEVSEKVILERGKKLAAYCHMHIFFS